MFFLLQPVTKHFPDKFQNRLETWKRHKWAWEIRHFRGLLWLSHTQLSVWDTTNGSILHLSLTVLPRGCPPLTDKMKLLDWNAISYKDGWMPGKEKKKVLAGSLTLWEFSLFLKNYYNSELWENKKVSAPQPLPIHTAEDSCNMHPNTHNSVVIYAAWACVLDSKPDFERSRINYGSLHILIKSFHIIDFAQQRQTICLIFQVGWGCWLKMPHVDISKVKDCKVASPRVWFHTTVVMSGVQLATGPLWSGVGGAGAALTLSTRKFVAPL